jgi:hypothetical protein
VTARPLRAASLLHIPKRLARSRSPGSAACCRRHVTYQWRRLAGIGPTPRCHRASDRWHRRWIADANRPLDTGGQRICGHITIVDVTRRRCHAPDSNPPSFYQRGCRDAWSGSMVDRLAPFRAPTAENRLMSGGWTLLVCRDFRPPQLCRTISPLNAGPYQVARNTSSAISSLPAHTAS